MIESLLFLIVGIGLYLFSDWIVKTIEARLGRHLSQRSVVFFGILLVSALSVFALIRAFAPA